MRVWLSAALLMLLILLGAVGTSSANPQLSHSRVLEGFKAELIEILSFLRESAIELGRILAGTLIAVGVVLWASDVFSYKGRKLITSGVILYFVLELLS